jgi:hypothetical protein
LDDEYFHQDEKGISSRSEQLSKAWKLERARWIWKTARKFAWLEHKAARLPCNGKRFLINLRLHSLEKSIPENFKVKNNQVSFEFYHSHCTIRGRVDL